MQQKETEIIETINKFSALIRYIIQKNLYESDDIDPEDVEQEVKIKIWKYLLKGKKIKKLSSYISKVAFTITIDELRKMRKQTTLKYTDGLKNLHLIYNEIYGKVKNSPEFLLEEKESKSFIENAIHSLSNNRRQVLRLYANGMTIEEICELFHWDKVKVRHLLYRGIDDLKKRVQEKEFKGIE